MYVVGIAGSPRRGGNTETLLDKAIEGASSAGAEIRKIILNELSFVPCQECDVLKDDGSCVIEDDMRQVYRETLRADAIIVASPIFFGSVSAQTKMMIDRFQCLWRAKNVLSCDIIKRRRPGIFIAALASDREDFFDNARAVIRNWFATINVDYGEELCAYGVEHRGDVLKRPEILKEAFSSGMRIVSGFVKG
jgi:hypothetical protein